MSEKDNYYSLHQVSNSTLSALKNRLKPADDIMPEAAFRFGSLVDAMVFEPDRVDWLRQSLDNIDHSDIFHIAKKCYMSLKNDKFAWKFIDKAEHQKTSFATIDFTWNEDFKFSLDCRCKWDFFGHISGDLKTTACTTQKQFDSVFSFLDYDRARAFYMDIDNTDTDLVIGVSKVNFKIFYKQIKRNDTTYLQGKDKYTELAFKYYILKNQMGL